MTTKYIPKGPKKSSRSLYIEDDVFFELKLRASELDVPYSTLINTILKQHFLK